MKNEIKSLNKAAGKKSMERFVSATGKTESEYYAWAEGIGRKMHINKLDALICSKLNIYTLAHLVYRSTELPRGIAESDIDSYLIENSENPYELAKLWMAARINARNYTDKESILAEHLRGIRKRDYQRFGDSNNLDSVSKTWFKRDSTDLDVRIEEINSICFYGPCISIQDAIEFVTKFRPGQYKNPSELVLEKIEDRFKAITSFQVKDYYIEHIMRMCQVDVSLISEVPF